MSSMHVHENPLSVKDKTDTNEVGTKSDRHDATLTDEASLFEQDYVSAGTGTCISIAQRNLNII